MVGSESPSSLSSDSFRNREMSLRRSSAGNMTTAAQILFRAGGSFKKKLTPTSGSKSKSAAEDSSSSGSGAKGGGNKSTSNIYSHIRTPSDSAPVYAQINSSHRNSGHWRNRSVDLVSNNTTTPLSTIGRNSNQGHNTLSSATTTSDNKSVMSKTPPGTLNGSGTVFSSLQRPRCPPPPLPPHHTNTPVSRATNHDHDHSASRIMYQEITDKMDTNRVIPVPVPPPRKVSLANETMIETNVPICSITFSVMTWLLWQEKCSSVVPFMTVKQIVRMNCPSRKVK